MTFNALFIAHTPDADKIIHRSIIKTGMYKLITLEICNELVEPEKIDSILLCPGFTHLDVAEIIKATDNKIAVVIARGDGPSGRIAQAAMQRAGYKR
jgi:hypothetical protein